MKERERERKRARRFVVKLSACFSSYISTRENGEEEKKMTTHTTRLTRLNSDQMDVVAC